MEFIFIVTVVVLICGAYSIGVSHGLKSAQVVGRDADGFPVGDKPLPTYFSTRPACARRQCPCGDPNCMEGP